MEDLEKRIGEISEKAIEFDPKLFLVDIKIKGNVGNQKVLVFVDGDDGIDIDKCSVVSRSIGAVLEEEDLIKGKYSLEVSSPGLDHPIKLKRQYKKNEGRSLQIETVEGEKIEGKLMEVGADDLTLETNGKERSLSFSEINQSKIVVSFK